jgi:hypothetical protein
MMVPKWGGHVAVQLTPDSDYVCAESNHLWTD